MHLVHGMSIPHEIRCYEHVSRPYPAVRALLADDARGLFARATRVAAARAEGVTTQLELRVGPISLTTEVDVTVIAKLDTTSPLRSPACHFELMWSAIHGGGFFPVMRASLWVYAISSHETQVVFAGDYEPPLGLVGAAFDLVLGRRIAEACAMRFVREVAAELRQELPASTPGA
jgi:hypothetical protein